MAVQTQLMSPQAAKYAAGLCRLPLACSKCGTPALLGQPKLGCREGRRITSMTGGTELSIRPAGREEHFVEIRHLSSACG